MADAQIESPAWWIERLTGALASRGGELKKLRNYYEGVQPAMLATQQYREEFSAMLRSICDNWLALVVEAVEERLHVEGFRVSPEAAADDQAWSIWQRNQLDADSELGHNAALVCGSAYALVWADDKGEAEITIEDPTQVLVEYVPGSRRKRAAAVKCWTDDWTGDQMATLYLPKTLYRFVKPKDSETWRPRAQDAEVPNPLGVVPIVPLINRPRLLVPGAGRSEITDVMSTQDQINKLVCDMLVASEFGAYKQRWATGIEIPLDPETNRPTEAFKAAVDRLWHVADPQARFGEFSQTDLGVFVTAIENRVQSLASRTRTPPHYLLGSSGSFPSGESLKATETGLIAKARSKMRHFGESWEEVIRLALAVETGSEPADAIAMETIWADPESRSESEHVDASIKKLAAGVPKEQVWEDLGYSPQQIARMKSMLMEEALNTMLAQPPAPLASANTTSASASLTADIANAGSSF